MHSPDHRMFVFVNRLQKIANLPPEAGEALEHIASGIKNFAKGDDIVSHGDDPQHCTVILEGWVCSNKVTAEGKRQITGLHFAGIAPDLQGLFTSSMDHNITALTPVRASFVSHGELRKAMEEHPALAQALWQETLVEAAIAREWEVNLGARRGMKRIAHILCELALRLDRFGLAEREGPSLSFEWPLTQTELGELVGLSTVHVNRSLMALRGIVEVLDRVKIYDPPRLEAYAGFNPDYLSTELAQGSD